MCVCAEARLKYYVRVPKWVRTVVRVAGLFVVVGAVISRRFDTVICHTFYTKSTHTYGERARAPGLSKRAGSDYLCAGDESRARIDFENNFIRHSKLTHTHTRGD